MATLPTAGSNALSFISKMLNTILNSRLQRKAKNVILSSAQCLIVLYAIFQTYQQLEIENPNVEFGLRISIYVGAAYTAFVALFLFVHSLVFLKDENMQTTENVEKAYSKTNKVPFPLLDGILELPFPAMFRGPLWFLSYFAWTVAGGVIGMNSYLFYIVREDLNTEARATLTAGALLLYQITSDFSEYWVYSRNREIAVNSGSNATGVSGSVNEEDVDTEASNLVGKREIASAGFTRI